MREVDEPDQDGGVARFAARWRRGLQGRFRREQDAANPQMARRRIAAWAMLIGLVIGFIDLALPLEDSFRAVRAAVRSHPADQEVLIVTVDEKTLNALGVDEPRRSTDAEVLDQLFSLGAERVFFGRAYADLTSPDEDAAFARALGRYSSKVYLGGTPDVGGSAGPTSAIVPNELFRANAQVVSMFGETAPFGLSSRFPTNSVILGDDRPSFSAELARVDIKDGTYRPDFALDHYHYSDRQLYRYLDRKGSRTSSRGKGYSNCERDPNIA
jgi:diguanylate cyclase